MGHSKIDLTMNCYADPRLLDVSGALDQLPALSLNRPTSQESATALVTDTDDQIRGSPVGSVVGHKQRPGVHIRGKTCHFGQDDQSADQTSVAEQNRAKK
jgi:hypothetical protein